MTDYLIPLIGGLISFVAAVIGSFAGGGYVLMMFLVLLMIIPGSYAGHLAIVKLGALAITIMAGQSHFRKNSISRHFYPTLFNVYVWIRFPSRHCLHDAVVPNN